MSKRGGYLCLTFRLLLFASTFVLSVPFLHIRVRVDNGADIVNEFRSLVVQGNSEERDRIKNGCDVDLGSNRDAKHGYSVDEFLQEYQDLFAKGRDATCV